MDEDVTWGALKPLFESMLFNLGYQEVARRTKLNAATVYRLANGDQQPQPRTLRDVEAAVRVWLEDGFSRLQQSMAEGD